MSRLLFLLSELSSQFGPNMRTIRKLLPPGLHYMTGESANIRIDIYPDRPELVVQSAAGLIIGIIDRMGFIRSILNENNKIVQINPRRNNFVNGITNQRLRYLGLEFNVRAPLHQSDSDK